MSTRVLVGDCRALLAKLPANLVQTVVTSPPYYGLRDYGSEPLLWGAWSGSLGLEPTTELYIAHLVACFREVRRVLRPDGTVWLNLGDSYAGSGKGPSGYNAITDAERRMGFVNDRQATAMGSRKNNPATGGRPPPGYKHKDLMLLPFRAALALQQSGWFIRSVVPWIKRNPLPESVADRPASAVEYVFLLTRSERYFWDGAAVRHQAAGGERRSGNSVRMIATGGEHARTNTHNGSGVPWQGDSRSRRNSDWFFESWQGMLADEDDDPLALVVNVVAGGPAAPDTEAHYARFPPKLVEPMLRASTSAHGQCRACGKHWRSGPSGRVPSCRHQGEPSPQLVLDPFAGSGTVGQVAQQLGLDALLCELRADYIGQNGTTPHNGVVAHG